MDMTQIYPEGMDQIIADHIIDEACEYYQKAEVSDKELENYITLRAEEENEKSIQKD